MKCILMSVAVMVLVSGTSAAFAKNARQEEVPYAFKVRCETLQEKFDAAQTRASGGAAQAAQAAASQGAALCRAGRYEEGGNELAKALRMLGEQAY